MRGRVPVRCVALESLGLEHAFACPDELVRDVVCVRQVHGAQVLRVPGADSEADALFTSQPGVAVGVRTADCVPILLADSEQRVVAALHAGWRGSAARVAEVCVARVCHETGLPPSALHASLGPHIGPCCYEVDAPVRTAIAATLETDGGANSDRPVFRAARPGHWMLDLGALNIAQLLRAGLQLERIARAGGCNCCDPIGYPSYRRSGSGERMTHYIRLSRKS